jgi:thiosulfate reductase/polysulfide reductase chain A
VLSNEDLINFHVCINCFYNETAHYADIVLPWATYMERWDLDARAAYNLRPYVGLRTPMVEPLGEARDIRDFFPDLARRIGNGMEDAYQYGTTEDYMKEWASAVPETPATGKAGLERLLEEGAWENPDREPFYEPYLQLLTDEELASATVPADEGDIIMKNDLGIGIVQNGKPVRGFTTPSRQFEIRSLFVEKIGRNEDCSDLIASSGVTKTKSRPAQHEGHDVEINSMPIWLQLPEHEKLADDELVMTSFKWNVHNHGRTMHLKWLAEIVHSNPAWMNPATAEQLGLKDGDWIELTSYFSTLLDDASPHLQHVERDESGRTVAGTMRVPIVTMPGIHPKVIAMSNSCGHSQYTNVAQAKRDRSEGDNIAGMEIDTYRDADWERNMWWQDESRGEPKQWQRNTGNGWNQNAILPIAPDPVTGEQAFHSTVVKVASLSTEK